MCVALGISRSSIVANLSAGRRQRDLRNLRSGLREFEANSTFELFECRFFAEIGTAHLRAKIRLATQADEFLMSHLLVLALRLLLERVSAAFRVPTPEVAAVAGVHAICNVLIESRSNEHRPFQSHPGPHGA